MRRGLDKAAAEAKEGQTPEDGSPGNAEDAVADSMEEVSPVDINGGLAGLEAFVELSLNGQNFTEDRVHFTYHGAFEPVSIRVIAPPDGVAVEDAGAGAPAAKGKDKGKKGEDTGSELVLVHPGSKLACEIRDLIPTESAMIRAELSTKVGDEEPQPFRTVEFAAQIEKVSPAPAAPVVDDTSKGKKDKDAAPPPDEEAAVPIDMLVAFAPSIRTEDLPDPSATLIMGSMAASLNGKYFVQIADAVTWRLQPIPPEAEPEG